MKNTFVWAKNGGENIKSTKVKASARADNLEGVWGI